MPGLRRKEVEGKLPENFAGYEWQYQYRTSALNQDGKPTDILHDFYIPALTRAVKYDRVAGYFRSTSLAAASQGYTAFLRHGGTMRLVVGADLALEDVAAILKGCRQRLSDCLNAELASPEDWPESVKNGIALLGEMVASGCLEVRVGFRVDNETGGPLAHDSSKGGYVHEKWFVMVDSDGNRLYGNGSLNESRTALTLNSENIDLHCDWRNAENMERTDRAARDFDAFWNNENPHMRVIPVPEAVRLRLVSLRALRSQPTEIDGTRAEGTPELSPKDRLRFAVLRNAPRMPGGELIGMYSAPVSPWPHQESVSRRLIESWPYSWLLCDEVGLGKTIEAALAIRSLVLSGRVKRVLIVAPASLTEQWHRELAEKALLPFALSRAVPGGFCHSYIYPHERQETDEKLYGPDLNIVSSGLVRRKSRLAQLRTAGNFDIVLVDEAHYARRKNPQQGTAGMAEYGDLYKVMRGDLRKKTRALWMATATPMQIAPIEVYDLFSLTGRTGQFTADPTLTMTYFDALGELACGEGLNSQEWFMLGRSFEQIKTLDPYLWGILNNAAITNKNRRTLENLTKSAPSRANARDLVQPLFAASPLSRVMMRHTRALLELYREHGQLSGNLAHRHVLPIRAIEFTPAEREFYEMLESYCKGLGEQIGDNADAKQVMAFLLNFLRLRFASSFYAIEQSLSRRLNRVEKTLLVGESPTSEEQLKERLDELRNDAEDYDEGDLDDITMDALLKGRSVRDLEWEKKRLREMLDVLNAIHDMPSKTLALMEELEERKLPGGRLRQTVVFTRFYDTLISIKNRLFALEPSMRVGVYAGGGRAAFFDPSSGKSRSESHEEVKSRFLGGEIDLLLCTDAAAEGLNLQTADRLINFDLGWNPMKIEQRIGRIDRIGQKNDDIYVVNMCYAGSEEETVYGRLVERLKQANAIVGSQQVSLLPVTREDFQKLHDGEMTWEELKVICDKRMKEQKETNARMEISASDMYDMYRRASEKMKTHQFPATTDDLRSCLESSGLLNKANKGSVSWGNPDIDAILSSASGKQDDTPYLRLVTTQDNFAGIAVATPDGAALVTSWTQIDDLDIESKRILSDEDVRNCAARLFEMTETERERIRSLERAEKLNSDIADLHASFIARLAAKLLIELESEGYVKVMDAVKQLENHEDIYSVDLIDADFMEGTDGLLFQVHKNSAGGHVIVNGILLDCVIDLVRREARAIHMANSEKRTADVVRRLQRR